MPAAGGVNIVAIVATEFCVLITPEILAIQAAGSESKCLADAVQSLML